MLLGERGEFGTGTIPKDAIAETVPARGIPGLCDTIMVRTPPAARPTWG